MSGSVYRRSPTAPKQVRFPPRSRVVKLRSSASSTSRKRQSTLTQLDYISTPSGHTREVPCSDDEEFDEPLPKKRRRVSSSAKKPKDAQSTLTQNVGQLQSNKKSGEVMNSDDEGSSDLEENDEKGILDHSNDHPRNIPQTPRRFHASSVSNTSPRDIVPSSYQEEDSTRPTSAESCYRFQTPKRGGDRVIPSSETPSSLHLSPTKFHDQGVFARSPLKERSTNLPPLHVGTPSRQGINGPKPGQGDDLDNAEVATGGRDPRTKPRPDKSPQHPSSPNGNHNGGLLERTHTIADSEADAEELENLDDDFECGRRNKSGEDESGYLESYLQYTYDPINAALDLDAARFGSTQRYPPGRQVFSRKAAAGAGDIDSQAIPGPRLIQDSQATQDDHRHEHQTESHRYGAARNKARGIEKNLSTNETQSLDADSNVRIPSSPTTRPPTELRPSQISTVVSTQDSYATAHRYIARSPRHSISSSPDTTPSSPLALPPWSLPALESHPEIAFPPRRSPKSRQLESLADFSLPPLPPSSSQIIQVEDHTTSEL